jgi:hypothetical protein
MWMLVGHGVSASQAVLQGIALACPGISWAGNLWCKQVNRWVNHSIQKKVFVP